MHPVNLKNQFVQIFQQLEIKQRIKIITLIQVDLQLLYPSNY